jgi:hypothetical protein
METLSEFAGTFDNEMITTDVCGPMGMCRGFANFFFVTEIGLGCFTSQPISVAKKIGWNLDSVYADG